MLNRLEHSRSQRILWLLEEVSRPCCERAESRLIVLKWSSFILQQLELPYDVKQYKRQDKLAPPEVWAIPEQLQECRLTSGLFPTAQRSSSPRKGVLRYCDRSKWIKCSAVPLSHVQSPVMTIQEGAGEVITVAESGAICQLLVERYGNGKCTIPVDADLKQRADYLFWTHFAEVSRPERRVYTSEPDNATLRSQGSAMTPRFLGV